MATVQEIITAAYNKSAKNRPGTITTDATELVATTFRALSGLFAVAARVNPIYFSSFTDVAPIASTWLRPVGAESIFRLEYNGSGLEIVVVPFDDRAAEPSKPAVYELGGLFRRAGNASDPSVETIRFWYSRLPGALANLSDPIDVAFPVQYHELLVHEVAIYLAMKDGRMDEIPGLQASRDGWASLYMAHLEHATANLRSRFGQVRRFTTNTLVPIKAMLAGGG